MEFVYKLVQLMMFSPKRLTLVTASGLKQLWIVVNYQLHRLEVYAQHD